jgi:hypothetical protein
MGITFGSDRMGLAGWLGSIGWAPTAATRKAAAQARSATVLGLTDAIPISSPARRVEDAMR